MSKVPIMPEPEPHQFYRMHASPYFWRMKADELRHAADILWPECVRQLESLTPPFRGADNEALTPPLMTFTIFSALAGFSIECLLKGTAIKQDQTLISNGNLAGKLQNHNLLKLARLARVPLSQNEHIFCKHVNHDMEVEFRYPVAKSHTRRRDSIQLGGKWPDVYHGLFNRLRPGLNVLIQGRGKSSEIPE